MQDKTSRVVGFQRGPSDDQVRIDRKGEVEVGSKGSRSPMEGIQDIIRWDAVRTNRSLSEKPTRCAASKSQGIQLEVDAGRRREEDKEKEGAHGLSQWFPAEAPRESQT
ncbi:hypothetical protein B296_00044523 [Ensete ventricosum]|uniref:Uncharacterized protein n=1 Tax=Ensete ventricosum TaxID=4639 RepID=A0A426ZAR1_ENSVE|nr:hypothetical protein B296_00044523 [Ensete ventricosum]